MAAAPTLVTPWILWGALLMSHLILGGVGFFLSQSRPPDFSPQSSQLFLPLLALAVMTGIASLFVNLVLNNSEKIQNGVAELRQNGTDRQKTFLIVLQRLVQKLVLGSALAESVTIFGFVLFFTGQIPLFRFFAFVAAGLVLHLIGFPKTATLQESLQKEFGS